MIDGFDIVLQDMPLRKFRVVAKVADLHLQPLNLLHKPYLIVRREML